MTDAPQPDAPAPDAPAPDAPAPDAPATPEWLAALPDDLKGNETLGRFKDTEALARSFIETQKLARSKVQLPGDGATDDDWGKFWNSIGRPESADGYTDIPSIELPVDASDEMRAARDEAMKPYKELAFNIGLTPSQAKQLAQFDLDRAAAVKAQSAEQVEALKTALGRDYEPKRQAAQQVFAQIFGDGGDAALMANAFDEAVGNSGTFLKGMMRLAEIAGEAKLIDGDDVPGLGDVSDANATLEQLRSDPTWREKRKNGDATVVAQEKNLLNLATRQALRRGR